MAFAWHAMDAFYEEDERILGHASDPYHRIDIRQTSRHLVVRAGDEVVAETHRPLVLYESGFAPAGTSRARTSTSARSRPCRARPSAPTRDCATTTTSATPRRAAWSYREAYREVDRIDDLISFEPDKVTVTIDGERLELAPGQQVVAHGADRGLTPEEVMARPCRDCGGYTASETPTGRG